MKKTLFASAAKGMIFLTGCSKDDSHDHFIINFPVVTPLDDLNDDWHIVKITDSVIELKDESGSGGNEYLTFKNK
jgi:hypothetical protein